MGVGACRLHRDGGAVKKRAERLVRPVRAPFIVVRGRSLEKEAGVMGRAAADDARPEGAVVLAARSPVVRERERAGVEQLLRPAAVGERPVVGPGLDEANVAGGILG